MRSRSSEATDGDDMGGDGWEWCGSKFSDKKMENT